MEKKRKELPEHLVIIPDANRRWAKERGLKPWMGHEEGAKNIEKLTRFAFEKGVYCLSFWGSSVDNLTKRPVQEKMALLDIYKRYFKRLLEGDDLYDNEIRVNIIGRWESQFPESLKKTLREIMEKTRHFEKKVLNFLLAYSGDDEMLEAIEKIHETLDKGAKITAEIVKKNLMTSQLPAVDYLIRTGGEPHLSAGFMMWDTANSQLYFSEEKFPDFTPEKLDEALNDYSQRSRRFGK